MKVVRFGAVVNGWPWGWGAQRVSDSGTCRMCGWPGRKKPPKSSLVGMHRMANGMDLCTTCARRTLEIAFETPLGADDLAAVRAGRASLAIPMADHLAALYVAR